MSKKKPSQDAINLALSVFSNLNDQSMLTPEDDSLLEEAVAILENAEMLDENGELIQEEDDDET